MQGTIAVIGGDGVGREIVEQGVKALRAVEQRFGHSFTMPSYLLGEDAYKATGNSAPPETIKGCQEAQAVLFGAIGGVLGSDAYEKSNTASPMLVLRGALKVFCNLRPIKYVPALERRSPLKA
ncbi:MAG: 3-isopropylmalate dehydrogenase, partial [Chloroflexi bacterium]|nr:3-isopropylmalate dehydrogenase [Chloroflexota bacterium]